MLSDACILKSLGDSVAIVEILDRDDVEPMSLVRVDEPKADEQPSFIVMSFPFSPISDLEIMMVFEAEYSEVICGGSLTASPSSLNIDIVCKEQIYSTWVLRNVRRVSKSLRLSFVGFEHHAMLLFAELKKRCGNKRKQMSLWVKTVTNRVQVG